MTQKEKRKIRCRDKYWYSKLHGPIPAGYTMHHLSYSETYDEDSFVVITKAEHDWIHGKNINCSEGFDYVEYYANNRERLSKKQKEYHQLNKDKRNEQSRNYRAKVKAVRMSNGLSRREWYALTKEDRKRLMDTFMENGGIT